MKMIQSIKVATFRSHAEASKGVDYLASANFPVEKVSIIADELEYAVAGSERKGLDKVLFSGLVKGAGLGAVVGALVGIAGMVEPIITGLIYGIYGALIGGLCWAIFMAVVHIMKNGRRKEFGDLASAKYHISVQSDVASQATSMLSRGGLTGITDDIGIPSV